MADIGNGGGRRHRLRPFALSRKLMPVTPTSSHCRIVRTRWSGSPMPTPSGRPLAALGSSAAAAPFGAARLRSAAPALPSVWYALVGYASRVKYR